MKGQWKEEVAKLTLSDVELRTDTFGEHFFKFYEPFMNERSGIFRKSFEDTGLCPLDSDKPKYSKLKSQMKCSQPIEGVEYRSIGVRKDRQSKISSMKSGTQTENMGISRGTNTSPGKANPADHLHTDELVLTVSTDDMVLDLHSERKNKSAIQARA
jgi:hypothetical protein